MPTRFAFHPFAACVAVVVWCSAAVAEPTPAASSPGIARFSQVDAGFYRGGQPDGSGFEGLKRLGIKTIVNLRRNDAERQAVEGLGMRYVDLSTGLTPFGLGRGIGDDVVRRFFEVVRDPDSRPVFLHCRRGADRTGMLVALYRIASQGWTAKAAYEEARAIGMRWWHFPVKTQLDAFEAQHRTETPPALPTPALRER